MKKLDLFLKLDDNFRVGTVVGGVFSLLSIFVTVILVFFEISNFLYPPKRQILLVDGTRPTESDGVTISQSAQNHFNISLSITFPSVPCYLLHLDVIDTMTQAPLPVKDYKKTFTRLGSTELRVLPSTYMETKPSEQCGSCYDSNKTCCRSCQDVFAAYNDVALAPPLMSEVEQCKDVVKQFKSMEGEGCKIDASFSPIQIQGEFHVAPGYSWLYDGWHVHDLRTFGVPSDRINLTHTINHLSFSSDAMNLPLDNYTAVQEESGIWRMTYKLDIVNNEFSASPYSVQSPQNMYPGVLFKYDVSPINAIEYPERPALSQLLIKLVTAIGGAIGFFQLIDMLMFMAVPKTREIS